MQLSMKFLAVGCLVFGLFAGAARAETVDDAIDSYLEIATDDFFAQAAPKKSPWAIKGNFGFTYRDGNTNITNFAMLVNAERNFGDNTC